jgi:hypothetical protein
MRATRTTAMPPADEREQRAAEREHEPQGVGAGARAADVLLKPGERRRVDGGEDGPAEAHLLPRHTHARQVQGGNGEKRERQVAGDERPHAAGPAVAGDGDARVVERSAERCCCCCARLTRHARHASHARQTTTPDSRPAISRTPSPARTPCGR